MAHCAALTFSMDLSALILSISIGLLLLTLLAYAACLRQRLSLAFTIVIGLLVNCLLLDAFRLLPYLWCYYELG